MPIDLKRLKEKYDQLQQNKSKTSGNLNFWKPKVGVSIIRILPSWNPKNGGIYFRDTAIHYDIGEESRRFVCLRAEGQVCPICELRNLLSGVADASVKDIAGSLAPTPKVYMNIVDLQHPELGVQIASLVGRYAVEQIHEVIVGYGLDPKWGDLTDPTYGRDITIERKGTGLETDYQVRPSPTPTPISSDPNIQAAILIQLKDLDRMVKLTPVEEMTEAVADIQEIANKSQPQPASVASAAILAPNTAARMFWVTNDKGEVIEATEAQVKILVEKGKVDVPCMLQGESAWNRPATYHILPTPKAAPKPTPPAPAKPTAPAPAKPAPAAPAKPTPQPAQPAAPIAPAAPAKVNSGKSSIPEDLQKCFGLKYNKDADDCQLCAYEAVCVQTQQKTT